MIISSIRLFTISILALAFVSCTKDQVFLPKNEAEEINDLLGSNNSVYDQSENAFGFVNPALTGIDELNFFVGNSFFNQNWVSAPSSTTARDGLGPTFNAKSCSSCHFKDGRGRPPMDATDLGKGLLFRFSTGVASDGGPTPDPYFGGQLQDVAIPGVEVEGTMEITYTETSGSFSEGETYSLRTPTYAVNSSHTLQGAISPRVARQLIGLGLLEAVTDQDILAGVDPSDSNGDGITGKANSVWDQRNQTFALGRFGWKADQPSLEQQVAKAFQRDLGITTTLYMDENCTSPQQDCLDAENGGSPELEDANLDLVVHYVRNLAVPAQRLASSSEVQRGQYLFNAIGCTGCHQETFNTGYESPEPTLHGLEIRPYTDLLLHDMGTGLADGFSFYEASNQEWRTPPLWGIGLFETVNQHTYYLHDGRARNLTEAILWHGGEAEARKLAFMALPKSDRDALISFLKSL